MSVRWDGLSPDFGRQNQLLGLRGWKTGARRTGWAIYVTVKVMAHVKRKLSCLAETWRRQWICHAIIDLCSVATKKKRKSRLRRIGYDLVIYICAIPWQVCLMAGTMHVLDTSEQWQEPKSSTFPSPSPSRYPLASPSLWNQVMTHFTTKPLPERR